MRLINIYTLEFEEFLGKSIPPYCILSHRWVGKETTYKDFSKGRGKESLGYLKVINFCSFLRAQSKPLQALFREDFTYRYERQYWKEHDVQWAWIDTCCIDKRSSAELSEAINSMFGWYYKAVCCYVFLDDVSLHSETPILQALRLSSWFTRGWTLQELLAPRAVVFCDAHWTPFGQLGIAYEVKQSNESSFGPELEREVAEITNISLEWLAQKLEWQDVNLSRASVAEKLSWAAGRKTTRVEDEAYCLLGILGVNMPLLYGEGDKAFVRLQEEFIKRSPDQSIFAWTVHDDDLTCTPSTSGSLLAATPRSFARSGKVVASKAVGTPFSITNHGVQITAPATRLRVRDWPEYGASLETNRFRTRTEIYIVSLNCHVPGSGEDTGKIDQPVKMALTVPRDEDQFHRLPPDDFGETIDLIMSACKTGEEPERSYLVKAWPTAWP